MTLIAVILQGTSEQTDSEAVTLLDYGFNNFQKLSLGENDFNLKSGGTVVIPATASEADVKVSDTEGENGIRRQYLFSGVQVGTAVLEDVQAEDTAALTQGQENLQEAYDFTANKSPVPYYVIGGVGAVLFLLLLVLMVKVIKSR